jgi:hypothetical protein
MNTGAIMRKFPDFKRSNIVSIHENKERHVNNKERNVSRVKMPFARKVPIFSTGCVLDFIKLEKGSGLDELSSGDDGVGISWRRDIGDAMKAWKKLTEAELLATNGHAHSLSRLVEERYATTPNEAEALVKIFFESLDEKRINEIQRGDPC